MSFLFLFLSLFFLLPNSLLSNSLKDFHLKIAFRPSLVLDPHKSFNYVSSVMSDNLYSTLIKPAKSSKDNFFSPSIAEDWVAKYNGKEYVFYLKENIYFHSGNEITTEDVLYSYNRFIKVNKRYGKLLKTNVSKVIILDKNALIFRLKNQLGYFMSLLLLMKIVDKKAIANEMQKTNNITIDQDTANYYKYSKKILNNKVFGSGKYLVTSIKKKNNKELTLKLKQYNQYFENILNSAPKKVTIDIIKNEKEIKTLLEQGNIHIGAQSMTFTTLKEFAKTPQIALTSFPIDGQFQWKFNLAKQPFNSLNCRKSVVKILNYENMRNTLFVQEDKHLGSFSSYGYLLKSMYGANKKYTKIFKNEPKKAAYYFQKCQQEINNKKKFTINIGVIKEAPLQYNLAQSFKSNLEDLGFKVNIENIKWKEYIKRLKKSESTFNITASFLQVQVNDPHFLLVEQFHSSSKGNWSSSSWLKNKNIDFLIDKASKEFNSKKREKYYQKINNDLLKILPSIPVYNLAYLIPINKQIKLLPLGKKQTYRSLGSNFLFDKFYFKQ